MIYISAGTKKYKLNKKHITYQKQLPEDATCILFSTLKDECSSDNENHIITIDDVNYRLLSNMELDGYSIMGYLTTDWPNLYVGILSDKELKAPIAPLIYSSVAIGACVLGCVIYNGCSDIYEKDDSTDMTKNDDGSISLSPTYDSNDFSSVNISPSRTGYTFDGIYDADTDGNQVWDSNGAFVEGKYWDKNGNWIYDGNVTLYCHWKPIDYTMIFDYNKNGELTNADIDSKTVTYDSPYGELPDPGCAGWAFKEWNTKADGSGSTITKDDICKGDISVYALWSYKPVNVSVPQTLIGDKNGNSEFVVKSDDIESGSIDVTIPDGFYYNQEGKSPVYASISTDGDSKLTKDNTAIKYSIITDGLTAGCWSGSFNINLKLNK